MVGDVGSAYLEAYTKEKVYFIAGPEFGPELEGHTFVIVKALYGLHSSGTRYLERFADTLRDMGFQPSCTDPDLWMHDQKDIWEYICIYIDDLCTIMKTLHNFLMT